MLVSLFLFSESQLFHVNCYFYLDRMGSRVGGLLVNKIMIINNKKEKYVIKTKRSTIGGAVGVPIVPDELYAAPDDHYCSAS